MKVSVKVTVVNKLFLWRGVGGSWFFDLSVKDVKVTVVNKYTYRRYINAVPPLSPHFGLAFPASMTTTNTPKIASLDEVPS